MAIKPILFNEEMVRAILEGRKTQTRRIIKGLETLNAYRAEPAEDAYETLGEWDFFYGWGENGCMFDAIQSIKAPCSVGDMLWVRETFCDPYADGKYAYRADYGEHDIVPNTVGYISVSANMLSWHPSIHMPKEAARIFLRVKDVRVERLQEIDEEDAIAEGFADSPAGTESPLERFAALWDKTVKRDDLRKYGWHANPWVWVIEFERCEKPNGWSKV